MYKSSYDTLVDPLLVPCYIRDFASSHYIFIPLPPIGSVLSDVTRKRLVRCGEVHDAEMLAR